MIGLGLIVFALLFNGIAFFVNELNYKQVAHVYSFTIAFALIFDIFVDFSFHGYWYFKNELFWDGLAAMILLVVPANIVFLNWYPFNTSLKKQVLYFIYWELFLILFESYTLLPEPWGFFNYGWWNLWLSAAINPVILFILLIYYKKFIN